MGMDQTDRLMLTPASPASKEILKRRKFDLVSASSTLMTSSPKKATISDLYTSTLPLSRLEDNLIPPRQMSCHKMLNVPGLEDDYYLHQLDWSAKSIIAVGLNQHVGLWHPDRLDESQKCNAMHRMRVVIKGTDKVTSVSFNRSGRILACGTKDGRVDLFDVERMTAISNLAMKSRYHGARVGVLSWNGESVFSSGSRDRCIQHYDIRVPSLLTDRISAAHDQEVCGLSWAPNGNHLASGGNDNRLMIWDGRQSGDEVLLRLEEHTAAVKAIAWSHQEDGLLASGGGTADRKIVQWSLKNDLLSMDGNESGMVKPKCMVQTSSQVCNLAWSPTTDLLVSAHGFSENQCLLWSASRLKVKASMLGHEQRVLYMAMAPDGRRVATGSGDETIRIWNLHESPRTSILDIL